jgi:hypothetical protein
MRGVGLGEVPVVELVDVTVELGVETVEVDNEDVLEVEELTDWVEAEPVLDSGEEVLEELAVELDPEVDVELVPDPAEGALDSADVESKGALELVLAATDEVLEDVEVVLVLSDTEGADKVLEELDVELVVEAADEVLN